MYPDIKRGFECFMVAFIVIACTQISYAISDEEKQQRRIIGQRNYDAWCPNKNGVIEKVAPGYQVRYICDTQAAKIDSPPLWDALSIQQCANLCREKEGCVSSIWKDDGACFLSNQAQATKKVKGLVYIVPHGGQDDQKTCANDLLNCKKENGVLKEKLEQCHKKKDGGRQFDGRGDDSDFKCPEYDGKTLSTSGGDYQIYCSRGEHYSIINTKLMNVF